MRLDIDQDVQMVAEFMQERIPAARLAGVAAGINAIASLLWGYFAPETVRVLTLSDLSLQTQSVARGSDLAPPCADGDSAAATDGLV